MVYTNEIIEEIIAQKPFSIEFLYKISGLGKKKIELFGNEIIEILITYYKEFYKSKIEKLLKLRNKIAIFWKLIKTTPELAVFLKKFAFSEVF